MDGQCLLLYEFHEGEFLSAAFPVSVLFTRAKFAWTGLSHEPNREQWHLTASELTSSPPFLMSSGGNGADSRRIGVKGKEFKDRVFGKRSSGTVVFHACS